MRLLSQTGVVHILTSGVQDLSSGHLFYLSDSLWPHQQDVTLGSSTTSLITKVSAPSHLLAGGSRAYLTHGRVQHCIYVKMLQSGFHWTTSTHTEMYSEYTGE